MRRILLLAVVVSAPALAAPQVMPGQWQTVVTINSMTMPGMPASALAGMKQKPVTTTYCLTPKEAEADPRKLLAADKSCTVNRYSFAGGRIASSMTCRTDNGPATIITAGTYTPTSYAATSTMKSGAMTMASRVTAKRLGPCK